MPEEKITIDSNDYIELLIRHLARSPTVFKKAQTLKVTGDDFVLNETFGVQLYKHFVDAILQIGYCPITIELLSAHINRKFEDRDIPEAQFDLAVELMDFVFTGQLSPQYFMDTMKDFLKNKRAAKITYEHKNDPDLLYTNMKSLIVDLSTDDFLQQAEDVHPFAAPIFKQHHELLGTGLPSLDEKIHGLGLGEYALVVGYSGGGKTVLGCNIVSNNAVMGIPAQFLSLEADKNEISNRFYSKYFEIPYITLHKGQANFELEAKFKDESLQSLRETLAQNLSLIGLKGQAPLTADQLFQVVLNKYETTGFVPQVVVVDQLQFVTPIVAPKSADDWRIEKIVAAELDEMSHKTIGGQKFALWVLHQAKGKLKEEFTREEIDGFKGIIHKADLVMGIGRGGLKDPKCNLFSLKVRHCAPFSCKLDTEFEFMRFVDKVERKATLEERPTSNPIDEGPPPLPPSLAMVPGGEAHG